MGILDTIFGPRSIGFDQEYVSIIGLCSVSAVIVSGVLFGALNDRLRGRRTKAMMVGLVFLSGVFLVLLTVVVSMGSDYFSCSRTLSICLCVLGVFCNAGTYGLSYEAAVELIYPSREVFAGTTLTIYFNLFSSMFILLNGYLSPLYMNWVVAVTQLVAAGALCFHHQEYLRLPFDDIQTKKSAVFKTPTSTKHRKKYRKKTKNKKYKYRQKRATTENSLYTGTGTPITATNTVTETTISNGMSDSL